MRDASSDKLSYFSVVCLSHMSLPLATLHAAVVGQAVGTRREDLWTACYDHDAIWDAFHCNFSLIHGRPPQRACLPSLSSLIKFSPSAKKGVRQASPYHPLSSSDYFACCVHVPLFSLGLSMSHGDSSLYHGQKPGLHTASVDSARGSSIEPVVMPLSFRSRRGSKESPRHADTVPNMVQVTVERLDGEFFSPEGSEAVNAFVSIGGISLKNANGTHLLRSTELVKRYGGNSRVTQGINFHPLFDFPRVAGRNGGKKGDGFGNQVDAALRLCSDEIWAGVEVRFTRLEIGVDSLQLFESWIRAVVRAKMDLDAVAVTFPTLRFGVSQHSSACIGIAGKALSLEQLHGPVVRPTFKSHMPYIFRKTTLSRVFENVLLSLPVEGKIQEALVSLVLMPPYSLPDKLEFLPAQPADQNGLSSMQSQQYLPVPRGRIHPVQ